MKLKKIWDFEVVSFLTILILMTIFYTGFKIGLIAESILDIEENIFNYRICFEAEPIISDEITQKEATIATIIEFLIECEVKCELKILNLKNNFEFVSTSILEIFGFIVFGILLITNIIRIWIYLISYLIKYQVEEEDRKIIKDNPQIPEYEWESLPPYNIFSLYAIYKDRFDVETPYYRLSNYYEMKKIINRKGEIISPEKLNEFSEFEKKMLELIEEGFSEEIREKIEKNVLIPELKNNKLFEKKLEKEFVDKIVKNLDKITEWKNSTNVLKLFAYVCMSLIIVIIVFYGSFIFIPAGIYLFYNYNRIALTEKGKIDRIKIKQYIKSLKEKDSLTKEENYILYILTGGARDKNFT